MFNLNSALGIHVRSDRLVFAALRKTLRGVALSEVFTVEGFRELSPHDLRGRVERSLRSVKSARDNVILGLPREEVVVRYLDLPLEAEENLRQVVGFQVERFEPTEGEKSYFDYKILERDEKAKRLLLEIVMARQSLVDGYLDLLQGLGIFPSAVRFSGEALHQLLGVQPDGFPKRDPVVILDIGTDRLELVVSTSAERFFSEKAPVPAAGWTVESVLEELDVFLSRLELPGESIERLIIGGPDGERLLPEFRERFEDCEDLTRKLRLDRGTIPPGRLVEAPSALGLALSGLAGRRRAGVNLLPSDKRRAVDRFSLVPTFILAALLVVMSVSLVGRDYFQQRSLAARLDEQIRLLEPQAEQVLSLRRQIAERQEELDELRSFMSGRQRTLLVLKELTERIPDDSHLSSVNIHSDRVTIMGFSDSGSTLLTILQGESRHLDNVVSRFITHNPRVGKDHFNFEAAIRGASLAGP